MKKATIVAVCGILLLSSTSASADQKGRAIAKLVDKMYSEYEGEASEVELRLVNEKGKKTIRKMSLDIRENGEVDKMIISLLSPADVKGVKLLTWAHRSQDDDQWLFMPSIKRTKRISARGRTGSFLGSEFTYEDLSRPMQLEKFKFTFVREQRVGKRDTNVIDALPKDKNSGYSKQRIWVDSVYHLPLRIEYWDRKGKLLKVQSFKKYKKYKKRWWRAGHHEMSNKQNNKKSMIVYTSRELGETLADQRFAPSAIDGT